MGTYNYVNVSTESFITTVEMDHPPANTLSAASISELREVFRTLAEDENTRAILLTGNGRFFAAGADIKEFVDAFDDYDKARKMSQAGQGLCEEIESSKKPVIAAINGAALGGGLEVAMACHYRFMSEDAVVGLPELNLGLIPSFGGTQRMRQFIGSAVTMEYILTGKNMEADKAADLGLVQQVVAGDSLRADAFSFAEQLIAGKSMTSVERAVEAITRGDYDSMEDGLKREQKFFGELFGTHDGKEGVQAFLDKRKPDFRQQ
ncbi:enoyl-CoA hydratase-related protein [Natribacillus halophilus]|uniref:Short chain enoyl-CoA hydratase n=1 Tax=Natribacillus halophilus TaxID=549003 RepID=A0A1G8S5B4_9BACI|nr:enoyl-CoA hydratase-related protein [Natribacillus halophilus]SDJ24386.1 short chain enoyl-CoA hydratase [Natribacillus halophilus]